MSMTLAEIKYLTQYLIGDPQTSTYSDQMYQDSINYAVKDYAKKTGATYTEATITSTVDGFCSLPSNRIRIQRIYWGGIGSGLTPVFIPQTQLVESSFSFEAMKSPTWLEDQCASVSVLPKRWVLFTGDTIRLVPQPASTTGYDVTIGYVENPVRFTSLLPVLATDCVVGRAYRIATIGTTTFIGHGATTGAVDEEFTLASGITGTGTLYEIVDLRIPEFHQEFLKYAAVAWLSMLDGDGQDIQKGDHFMQMFNQLIGYSDPVLETKLHQARTQQVREV